MSPLRTIRALKARFPRLFPVLVAVGAIATVSGVAAAERLAKDDCCYPGSPCCHPGAPCCAGHDKQARN